MKELRTDGNFANFYRILWKLHQKFREPGGRLDKPGAAWYSKDARAKHFPEETVSKGS